MATPEERLRALEAAVALHAPSGSEPKPRRCSNYSGDHLIVSEALENFTKDYELDYDGTNDGQPHPEGLQKRFPLLMSLRQRVHERLLISYTTFVKAAMHNILTGKMTKKSETLKTLKQKKTFAQDFAVEMRTVTLHVRKEWYSNRHRPWMDRMPPPAKETSLDEDGTTDKNESHAKTSPALANIASSTRANTGSGSSTLRRGKVQVWETAEEMFGPDVFEPYVWPPPNEIEVASPWTPEEFEEEETDTNMEFKAGYDAKTDSAYRVVTMDDGYEVGDPEYAISFCRPDEVGKPWIATFADGMSMEITAKIYQAPAPPCPTKRKQARKEGGAMDNEKPKTHAAKGDAAGKGYVKGGEQ